MTPKMQIGKKIHLTWYQLNIKLKKWSYKKKKKKLIVPNIYEKRES